MMTAEERKVAQRASHNRYMKTEKGKLAKHRSNQAYYYSENGQAWFNSEKRLAYNKVFNNTPERKLYMKQYNIDNRERLNKLRRARSKWWTDPKCYVNRNARRTFAELKKKNTIISTKDKSIKTIKLNKDIIKRNRRLLAYARRSIK